MIARKHRFHGYGSLRSVYKYGQTIRGSLITAKFTNQETTKPYRLAVVVSRKVSKSAVVRNRIRRRIYEAVRVSAAAPVSGTSLVITVFSDKLATMPADQLSQMVEQMLQKIAPTAHS